jgi:hypothetical protein
MFQAIYEPWLKWHLKQRKGERKRRLIQGHGHAEKMFLEKVWYPAFRQFDHLHPEYEVADFRDGSRFLDFAFIRFSIRLAIEIDGYGPHSSHTSRWQFADSLMRQNHLTIDGWRILRFSYDDINEHPRKCVQTLQQFMGVWLRETPSGLSASDILETEVLRLAQRINRNLRPRDVCELFQIHKDRAIRMLHSMTQKQILLPAGNGKERIHSYKVNPARSEERSLFV